MAQTAHAATAVLERYKETPEVKSYLGDLENMRKVVMEVSLASQVQDSFATAIVKTRMLMMIRLRMRVPYRPWRRNWTRWNLRSHIIYG